MNKIKIFFMSILTLVMLNPAMVFAVSDTEFSFDNFAIVENNNPDVLSTPVKLNSGAKSKEVSNFDISGVFLGMPFEEVQNIFYKGKSLYDPRKDNSIIYTMHNDWKYNFDYECREQGIYVPDELEKCIKTYAVNRGVLYASQMHLVRPETGESIDIYFTSNATNNVVWRIVYNNDVNELQGSAEKFENQRQKKILAFWQNVLDKYGAPNSGNDKWITSANSYEPMMTAYYGSLDLVDMGRNASDAAQNVKTARENFQAKPYSF